jgi:hypothetical protein
MSGLLVAALLSGLLALAPVGALAMPPAAKQYLPVIPTADGPKAVHGAAPVARPDQLTPAARASLKGRSGAELRRVATATALGAPSSVDPTHKSPVDGAEPSFLSATFDALGQGPVLALLAGFALLTALLIYLARSGGDAGSGSSTS